MLRTTVNVKLPNLSRAAVRRAFVAAEDKVLLHHRNAVLAGHFDRAAVGKYAPAYDPTPGRARPDGNATVGSLPNPNSTVKLQDWIDRLAQANPERLKRWRAMQKASRGNAYASVRAMAIEASNAQPKDALGNDTGLRLGNAWTENGGRGVVTAATLLKTGARRPLVRTGHLKQRALGQMPTFAGPATVRRMKLRLPYYVNFTANRPGYRDVRRALAAISKAEASAMAKLLTTEFKTSLK